MEFKVQINRMCEELTASEAECVSGGQEIETIHERSSVRRSYVHPNVGNEDWYYEEYSCSNHENHTIVIVDEGTRIRKYCKNNATDEVRIPWEKDPEELYFYSDKGPIL